MSAAPKFHKVYHRDGGPATGTKYGGTGIKILASKKVRAMLSVLQENYEDRKKRGNSI